MNFESALHYVWSLGIPVVPLADHTGFQAACWRTCGRDVIVLAQQERFPARWLSDLLHETRHAGQCPEEQERSVIEFEGMLQNHAASDEEADARRYAEDVIFGGRSNEIMEKCLDRTGSIEGLSLAVPQIVCQEGVPVDALAYSVAYCLSSENKNWWAAATNLQDRTVDPCAVARDVFLSYADFGILNEADRNILMQALTEGRSSDS